MSPLAVRSGWPSDCRTFEDEVRDGARIYPAQSEPHVHFHEHGGRRHAHEHVHPESHAHSSQTDNLWTVPR